MTIEKFDVSGASAQNSMMGPWRRGQSWKAPLLPAGSFR